MNRFKFESLKRIRGLKMVVMGMGIGYACVLWVCSGTERFVLYCIETAVASQVKGLKRNRELKNG